MSLATQQAVESVSSLIPENVLLLAVFIQLETEWLRSALHIIKILNDS